MNQVSLTDKEYEAKWDAETLIGAQRIKDDPERLMAVQKAAEQILLDKKEEVRAAKRIADKKSNSQNKNINSENLFNVFKRI